MSDALTDRRGQPDEAQSKANERQVGGEHYKSSHQHWDFIDDHGYSYLQGCATKYLLRWRQKNGVQDVEKSLHFAEKFLERGNARVKRGHLFTTDGTDEQQVSDWLDANNVPKLERSIITNLLLAHQMDGRTRVAHAIELLGILLEQARAWEREETRRSQYGMRDLITDKSVEIVAKPSSTMSGAVKARFGLAEPRGFDPRQDVARPLPRTHLCATVGGPDREAKINDTVVVKSHLPGINGRSAYVKKIDGVWIEVEFDEKQDNAGNRWTCQYSDLTIIEKNA